MAMENVWDVMTVCAELAANIAKSSNLTTFEEFQLKPLFLPLLVMTLKTNNHLTAYWSIFIVIFVNVCVNENKS